jgi:cytochrome P450
VSAPTTTSARASRPYDEADLSSLAFWQATAAEREETFAVLRRERPVTWHPRSETAMFDDPNDEGFWAVVRHRDLVEVTKRHDDFISGQGIVFESLPPELLDAGQSFIAMDRPRHSKIRRLVSSAFTPRQLRRIDDRIRENAKRIVDDLAPRGEADWVTDAALLLPMHNICDMIGIPDADRLRVAERSRYVGGWNDPEVMRGRPILETMFNNMVEGREFTLWLAAQRREDPKDDLMSALVHAEVDGEGLTDHEVAAFFSLLTIAGNDTTRQSLSLTMHALTQFPDQRAWLMEDFEGRIGTAVEEFVRWATPIMTFRRTAAHDTELAGTQITEGDKVIMFYASANWDTDVFDHPERFDLSRNPNPHVSFGGGGIHHCLGIQLARTQISALYREVLHRLPDIESVGEPVFGVNNFFHTVNHLPVRFTPQR